ncbi:Xaa-Pro peptidase family protein [Candidatus Woesearchaeota archaeon]|nr:Xaa-Pro peptidase family protein [Candidatus Woesearchaeota archaeon]
MRLRQFQNELARKRMGLALFFSLDGDNPDPNLVYFTQYTGFGALAVTPKKAFLLVPALEAARAKKSKMVRVVVAKGRLIKALRKELRSRPKRVGIDKNRLSINFYKALHNEIKASYLDISGLCLRLRTEKTPREISIIRKACATADEIMHKTFWNFKNFKTETDISAFMINEVNKRGLKLAFNPVVASGKNACEAHHEPRNKKLNKGFCVIDFGVRNQGYCSDITRTIYIGTPTKKEVELYYKVLDVQTKLIDGCMPGKSFVAIDKKAHELFGKHSKNFTHLIGHGVGLEIHENPNPKVSKRRPITKLTENSVITIEPGLYQDNKFGIRIEDDILVTAKGPEVITKTGKNLLIIKKK